MDDNKKNVVPTDVYNATKFMVDLKGKYIDDQPEENLALGMFGYMTDIHSNILETISLMASEYSQEAIPTKAKYAKNVISHALSFGIDKIFATPAKIYVYMYLDKAQVENSMIDNQFIIDRDFKFHFNKPYTEVKTRKDALDSSSSYEYHLDYDIIIKRSKTDKGEYVFTAQYNIDKKNPFSDIRNPYLQSIGFLTTAGKRYMILMTQLHQIEYRTVNKRFVSANPLESKNFAFEYDSNLAAFFVNAKEGDKEYHLTPVYDGLYYDSPGYFCNYVIIDENNIRVIFNRDSYTPTANTQVNVTTITTSGADGNFQYNDSAIFVLSSNKYEYSDIDCMLTPIGASVGGENGKSLKEIKELIPREALARGSVTNVQDLNNYFNTINDSDYNNGKLYFLKSVDNNLERLYYSFLVLKIDGNVVPMNTLPVEIQRFQYDASNDNNYVLKAGNMIYYFRDKYATIESDLTEEQIEDKLQKGFLYFNPYLCLVNKSPFYISYFLTIINELKLLNFDYINQNSQYQYIATGIEWNRKFFTDHDTYTLDIDLHQNIDRESDQVVIRDKMTDKIVKVNMQVIAIFYGGKDNKQYRWIQGNFVSYDEDAKLFHYQFKIKASDKFDDKNNIELTNLMDLRTYNESRGYFYANSKMDLYILIKGDDLVPNARYDLDKYVPKQAGWIVTNKYSVYDGVDLYYNYSDIINSYINVKGDSVILKYDIDKFPVLSYEYFYLCDPDKREERIQTFVKQLEVRRTYIKNCMLRLEDSFAIDFKFFNTYGPCRLSRISDTSRLNKTDLSLTFRLEYTNVGRDTILPQITQDIKAYIENFDFANRLDMSNLEDYIKDKYNESLIFFEFVDFNGYGPGFQHIWRDSFEEDRTITPEFINVATKRDGTPDITYLLF